MAANRPNREPAGAIFATTYIVTTTEVVAESGCSVIGSAQGDEACSEAEKSIG